MEGHPSDDELRAYAWGTRIIDRAHAPQIDEITRHVATCERCRGVLTKSRLLPPFTAGQLIGGKYRVEHLLASGGMGAIVRALDITLDRHVAIKVLLPAVAADNKVRARFEREARVSAKIRSEHVARVLEIGEQDRAQYIVLEYLTGEDLTTVIQREGRLGVDLAVSHVLQACEALAEAHSLGIVHRDVKPANLFLTTRADGSSCIKVIDFGIAKTSNFARDGAAPDPGLTQSAMLGTPRYMAPEQIQSSSDVDARTDIWGLGITLYELLIGKAPFDGASLEQVFARIIHEPIAPPSTVRYGLPKALDDVLMRALDKDPDRRFGSVGELAAALVPFAPEHARISAERAIRVSSGNLKTSRGAASWRNRRRLVLLALPLVALVIVAFALVRRQSVPSIIGTPCAAGCGQLECIAGTCTKRCSAAADCAEPSECTSDGVCNVRLHAGFIYVGVPEDGGWTFMHDRGRRHAVAKLPFLDTDYAINALRDPDVSRAIDAFVERGFQVIVATSSDHIGPVTVKAKQYPNTRFLLVDPVSVGPNVQTINGRMYQAWYLAGYAAAQRSKTHRLGFVAGVVTSEEVRAVNAFTRGARRFDPSIVVEVRWLGSWFDAGAPDANGHYEEDRLATALMTSGCDAIANDADNGRVVAAVEAAGGNVVSIGSNSPDACDRGPARCMGATYWNWGPLYVQQFDAIHRGQPSQSPWESIKPNPDVSVVNLRLNPRVASSPIQLATAQLLAELTQRDVVFAGPYCSTGQRATCWLQNESVSDQELLTMCWFVEGVVDRVDGVDRPAQVPAACSRQR